VTNVGPTATYATALTNNAVNLYWPTSPPATALGAPPVQPTPAAASLVDPTTGTIAGPVTLPANVKSGVGSLGYVGYLGQNSTTTQPDLRQHPYWRSEQLQRVMNLTTTRTHQYAVWVTIGFFEVKRQGDLVMYPINPQLAFDILGPEIGAASGKTVRYRGFFLVDRLKLTGFNPSSPTAFRAAVVYRKRVQ
jgi:hypothetical protein